MGINQLACVDADTSLETGRRNHRWKSTRCSLQLFSRLTGWAATMNLWDSCRRLAGVPVPKKYRRSTQAS